MHWVGKKLVVLCSFLAREWFDVTSLVTLLLNYL